MSNSEDRAAWERMSARPDWDFLKGVLAPILLENWDAPIWEVSDLWEEKLEELGYEVSDD